MNVRSIIYKSLFRIEKEKSYSSIEIENSIKKTGLTDVDKRFYTQCVYGITENQIRIDYIIDRYSKIRSKKLDLSTLVLLRMGIYELMFLDKIPESATVNETVKLAAIYSSRSKGFINALLRTVCNNLPYLNVFSDIDDNVKKISVTYSVNADIASVLIRDYGIEKTEKILKAFNSRISKTTLRINTSRISVTDFLNKYPYSEKCDHSQFGVRINGETSSFGFLKNGLCYVQDESSQLAGIVLNPQENETIIDVCAAPGGKTFNASLLSSSKSNIISMDIYENKLNKIKEEAAILGLNNIKTILHDSTSCLPELIDKADKVICDVPCSGIGVIAKKPDIRNRAPNTNELTVIQQRILSSSSKYLKHGGTLVYSTCTITRSENEDIVEDFIRNNPDYYLEPFNDCGISSDSGMLTFLPDEYRFDGFFIAKIKKK